MAHQLTETIYGLRYEGDSLTIERSYNQSFVDEDGDYVETNGHWVLRNSCGEAIGIASFINDLADRHNLELIYKERNNGIHINRLD